MMVPNFAARPFLDTRPVWIVTVAAGLIALVLALVNVHLYLESNQALATQIELRDSLIEKREALNDGLGAEVSALNSVRWREVAGRVNTLNVVLEEHAFSWLTLLDDLEATLPYGVRVIAITPAVEEDGVGLGLDAVARTRGEMLDFLDRLIEDPHFGNPMPGKEQWPDTSMTVGYLFDVEMAYEPGAEPPPVEAAPESVATGQAVQDEATIDQQAGVAAHPEVAP